MPFCAWFDSTVILCQEILRCRERRDEKTQHPSGRQLLEQGNLSGMIEAMLDEAVQHDIDVEIAAGGEIEEPRVVEVNDEVAHGPAHALQFVLRFSPSLFAGVGDLRPVAFLGQVFALAFDAVRHHPPPSTHVQQEFPDGVSIGNRSGGRLFRSHALQEFKNGIPVPGRSFKGPVQLIRNAFGFRHGRLTNCVRRAGTASLPESFRRAVVADPAGIFSSSSGLVDGPPDEACKVRVNVVIIAECEYRKPVLSR